MATRFPDKGYCLERVSIPVKSVAARTGIVTYGRNNITYSPEAGSSHQLSGFFTDAMPDEPTKYVDSRETFGKGDDVGCTGCEACVRACPTGALVSGKFVIEASRCLDYINEEADPWPDYVQESFHNCLLGCLKCQEVCPRNRATFRLERAHESFTVEETRVILETPGADATGKWQRPGTPVWDSIHRKMTSLGVAGLEPLLRRNLSAVMRAEGRL